MLLRLTPGGKTLADEFKDRCGRGDFATALAADLQGLSVSDALVACLELCESNAAAFNSLREFVAPKAAISKQRRLLPVLVMASGIIPTDPFAGIDDTDYPVIRNFILSVRAHRPKLPRSLGWQAAKALASKKPFYPEFLRTSDRRQRICDLALWHNAIGPHQPAQVALFSLGGLYNYAAADAGTRPKGTTCILVARGMLHAAGCNTIWDGISPLCNVPAGLVKNLPRESFGFVNASNYDKGQRPKPGDIFHISGANFENGNDSTHVGLIIKVEGDTWSTVEGGGSDHVTKANSRKLLDMQNRYGRWKFENDSTAGQSRRLQGWYSVDGFHADKWMAGA